MPSSLDESIKKYQKFVIHNHLVPQQLLSSSLISIILKVFETVISHSLQSRPPIPISIASCHQLVVSRSWSATRQFAYRIETSGFVVAQRPSFQTANAAGHITSVRFGCLHQLWTETIGPIKYLDLQQRRWTLVSDQVDDAPDSWFHLRFLVQRSSNRWISQGSQGLTEWKWQLRRCK